jgi:hypothetical protein
MPPPDVATIGKDPNFPLPMIPEAELDAEYAFQQGSAVNECAYEMCGTAAGARSRGVGCGTFAACAEQRRCRMKSFLILVVLAGCVETELGLEQQSAASVVEAVVTARTLSTLPGGAYYVMDLASGGKVYTLDPKDGPIAFERIVVRTGQNQEPFWDWFEANVRPELRYSPSNEALTVGASADFQVLWGPAPARLADGFTCTPEYCDCQGRTDCHDMLFHTNVCRGHWFACTLRSGTVRCICEHSQQPFPH